MGKRKRAQDKEKYFFITFKEIFFKKLAGSIICLNYFIMELVWKIIFKNFKVITSFKLFRSILWYRYFIV